MGIWELITGKKKGLMSLTRSELRQQELLLGRQRDQLMTKIEKLADDKQAIFRRGAQSKSPELRRALAAEFEARTSEQLLYGRQLNIKSKEVLTVQRVRLVRENREAAGKVGLSRITESDMLKLARMIEDDAISSELYSERLGELLGMAAEADRAAAGEGTDATATLMHVWERMDSGAEPDPEAAFDEADQEVRARASRTLAED